MSDRDYLYRRAEAELLMAERSIVPEAVSAHYRLAECYLARVHGEEGRPAMPTQATMPMA